MYRFGAIALDNMQGQAFTDFKPYMQGIVKRMMYFL